MPEGTTVGQALEEHADLPGGVKGIAMLVNSAPAKRDKKLKDGDTLKVFRPVAGG
jgi:sulfur carrier protein ThiS